MQEVSEKNIHFFDETFQQDELSHYSLSFEVDSERTSFCVFDTDRKLFAGLGSYPQPALRVFSSNPWLRGKFHSSRIVLSGVHATLIPAALYSEEHKREYLQFNMETEEDEEVLSDRIEGLGIVNVYGVPQKMTGELRTLFPEARLVHVTTVLIESLYANYKNLMEAGKIFLNIRTGAFDLLVFTGKMLIYCNSFSFKTPEDLVYYLIFVMEQMNLNPEEIPVVLLGDIDRESVIHETLFTYVRNVEFAGRNEAFRYSGALSELPSHSYYTLFNSIQCVS